MPFTIRLSVSRIALYAAITALPVSAQMVAERVSAPSPAVASAVSGAGAKTPNATPAPASVDANNIEIVATTPDVAASDIECIAKVVHHEAGNQPLAGKLAVAQVIVNRAESGHFPDSVCAVANQPGQFFPLASYNPARDTPMWRAAVDAARSALNGKAGNITRGALFFHSAASRPDRFFRSRQRVTQLHDQIFYR